VLHTVSGLAFKTVSAYHQLLTATVDYLRQQKARGQRHVIADPDKLRALIKSASNTKKAQDKLFENVQTSHPQSEPIRENLCETVGGFGFGNENADLMFVVDDIGRDRGESKDPLRSKPGQLFSKIVKTMNLSCDEIYIANLIDPQSGQSSKYNPAPKKADNGGISPPTWLVEKIESCQPKIIVGLGKTAVELLLKQKIVLTRSRGTWQTYRDIPLMPTFHPAYLLRNQSLTEKRKIWEDMLAVMEKLNLAISKEQRGFFLSR